MKLLRLLPLCLALAALGCSSVRKGAPAPGDRLPDLPLVEFTQSEAASLDDAFGQAVLIEAFAHW